MSPFDAVFLALAAGVVLERPKDSWFTALAPLIALAIGFLPLNRFHLPATALAVCLVAPRQAAVALVLVIPVYADVFDALRASFLWMLGTVLLNELGRKSDGAEIPARLRGAPLRMFACGVLYFTLLPVAYL